MEFDRDECVHALVSNDWENLEEYEFHTLMREGHRGYENMTEQEIKDEYAKRFGDLDDEDGEE